MFTDKSLQFGQQNFFFLDFSDSDGTYDFASYMNRKGTILLARFSKDGNNVRYYAIKGTYSTIWAARASYTYVTIDQLNDQSFSR